MSIQILIKKASINDVYAIREISKISWIYTFPNEELGITREDLEARFKCDSLKEESAHHTKRQKVISEDKTQQYWIAKSK